MNNIKIYFGKTSNIFSGVAHFITKNKPSMLMKHAQMLLGILINSSFISPQTKNSKLNIESN